MDKYTIKIYTKAYRDIDEIYNYISNVLLEPSIAANMINKINDAILSLDEQPERYPLRKVGLYANKGYRQLMVKNYVIIYKVINEKKEVHIVTVSYARRKI